MFSVSVFKKNHNENRVLFLFQQNMLSISMNSVTLQLSKAEQILILNFLYANVGA